MANEPTTQHDRVVAYMNAEGAAARQAKSRSREERELYEALEKVDATLRDLVVRLDKPWSWRARLKSWVLVPTALYVGPFVCMWSLGVGPVAAAQAAVAPLVLVLGAWIVLMTAGAYYTRVLIERIHEVNTVFANHGE